MRAGKLDRRLAILAEVETGRDGLNQPVLSWVRQATVWAQARPERGAERFEQHQTVGTSVMTFHLRYRGTLTRQHRIRYDGRDHDILDVREIGRGVVTEIDCVARAD